MVKSTRKGPGAGSHNRNTAQAIEYISSGKNLFQICKCPIHATPDGEGMLVPLEDFGRQGSNGRQSMCKLGKPLIDRIKHGFWRSVHLILLGTIEQEQIDNQYTRELLDIPLIKDRWAAQIQDILFAPAMLSFETSVRNGSITSETYFAASAWLEGSLTLKALGVYKQGFASAEAAKTALDGLDSDLKACTSAERLKGLSSPLRELIVSDPRDLCVRETGEDGHFISAQDISFNWSKMNALHDGQGQKTTWRGPFHNTQAKCSAESSRLVKYLVEHGPKDDWRELARIIRQERPKDHQADHIFPLALGGRDAIENIEFLPNSLNLAKRDRLTWHAFSTVTGSVKSLSRMINADAAAILHYWIDRVDGCEDRFRTLATEIEADLRRAMERRRQNFFLMGTEDRTQFLSRTRPDLSPSKAADFIRRFERTMK